MSVNDPLGILNNNQANDPLGILDVKKKDVSFEDFKASMRGVSEMPKEYASEAPFTPTKPTLNTEIEKWYSQRGGLSPETKLNTFTEKVKSLNTQYESLVKSAKTQEEADKIVSEFNNALNTAASDLGMTFNQKEGKVELSENDLKFYEDAYKSALSKLPKEEKKRLNFAGEVGQAFDRGIIQAGLGLREIAGSLLLLDYIPQYKEFNENQRIVQEQQTNFDKANSQIDKNISESLENKEYGKALGGAILGSAESVPSLMLMFTNPTYGLLAGGLLSANEKDKELQKDASISDLARGLNVVTTGLLEIATEKLTTIPMMEASKKALINIGEEGVKNAASKTLASTLQTAYRRIGAGLSDATLEATSEALNQYGQNFIEKITVNSNKDVTEGVIDAFAIGFVTSGVIKSPQIAVQTYDTAKDLAETAFNKTPKTMSVEDRVISAVLIAEKDAIQEQNKGIDKSLQKDVSNEVAQIDSAIKLTAQPQTVKEQVNYINEQINEELSQPYPDVIKIGELETALNDIEQSIQIEGGKRLQEINKNIESLREERSTLYEGEQTEVQIQEAGKREQKINKELLPLLKEKQKIRNSIYEKGLGDINSELSQKLNSQAREEGINLAKKQLGEEIVPKTQPEAIKSTEIIEPTKVLTQEKEALKQPEIDYEPLVEEVDKVKEGLVPTATPKVFNEVVSIANQVAQETGLVGEELIGEVGKRVDEVTAGKITADDIIEIKDEILPQIKQEVQDVTIQEQGTTKMDVRQQARDGKEMAEGDTQVEAITEEGKQVEKPTKEKEVRKKVEKVEALEPDQAKTRIRGVEQNIFQETKSEQQKFVQTLVDANKESYDILTLKQASEDAKQYIADKESIEQAYEDLAQKTKNLDELPTRQVARLSLIDFYSRKAINPNVTAVEQNDAIDKVMTLEKLVAREGTKSGQASAVLAIWKSMQPEGILKLEERKIQKYNEKILNKKIAGKTTIKQQIENVADLIDKESKNIAKDIINKNKKYKELRDKANTKQRKPVARRIEINKEKIQAEKEYRKKRLEQFKTDLRSNASATIIPGITQAHIEFAGDMIASYVREGLYRLSDITNKLKSDFKSADIDITDDQIKQIISKEKDGTSLEKELKRREIEIDLPLKAKQEGFNISVAKEKLNVANKLDDIITRHWEQRDALRRTLAQQFVEEAGLTTMEAEELQNMVLEEFNKQIKAKSEKELSKLLGSQKIPKEKAKKKSTLDKLTEAINLGALENEFYNKLFAEYFGLRELTNEQRKEIIKRGDTLQRLKGLGNIEAKASKELIDYIYEIYPPNKATEFVNMWEGLIYASMLSGPFTSVLNIVSSSSNILLRPIKNVTNLTKWAALSKGKKNIKEAKLVYNPVADMYYSAAIFGIKAGAKEAQQILKEGGIDSKFIDQVSKDNTFRANELERPKYGEGKRFKPVKAKIFGKEVDLNIFNLYKYFTRNLLAQDRLMFNMVHDIELANVVANKKYKEGLRGKALDNAVKDYIQGKHISEEYLQTRVDNDVALYEELTGKKLTELDKEIRKRQIILDSLDLTTEEKAEIEEVAQSNIFTDDRNGVVGHITKAIGGLANKGPVTKTLVKPFVMFTKIIGNLTETMLDATPLGFSRASGYSLTGLYKHFVDEDIQTSQMGDKGTRLYYEQMGRAWFGTSMMLLAMILSLGNDEEDWIEITGGRNEEGLSKQGKQNVTPDYTVRIGNVELPYKNIPLLAIPLGFIGNINDALKTDMSEAELSERITAALLVDAGFDTITMIKDMSIVEGIVSLLQMATDFASMTDDKLNKMGKDIVSRYITIAAKPIPTNVNALQQIYKFFDPTSYSRKDIQEMLAYAGGVQYFANNPNIDQLGDVVKTYPGETLLPYTHWFGLKGGDSRWRFLTKYDAIPNRKYNTQKSIETEEGFEKRRMTSDEFYQYTKLSGEIFSDKLRKYMDKDNISERNKERILDKQTDKEVTGIQYDVDNLRSKADKEAFTQLFRWGVAKKEMPKEYAVAEKYQIVKPYTESKTYTKSDGSKYVLDKDELYKYNTYVSLEYLKLIKEQKISDLEALSKVEYTDPNGITLRSIDFATDIIWSSAQDYVSNNMVDKFLNVDRFIKEAKK